MVVGRQVLLRLRGYISVCPTLQLSHNDVPGVGLGGCWNQVVPSHSHIINRESEREKKNDAHPAHGGQVVGPAVLLSTRRWYAR